MRKFWRAKPAALMLGGALVLLGVSAALPYWQIKIKAPQYPKGLFLTLHINRMEGDVREIDLLNHYIGMKPLEKGAEMERRLAVPGLVLLGACLILAVFLPKRWAWWALLPVSLFPWLFAGDLFYWLYDYGHHLYPKAPLKIPAFMPPLLGDGKIAQFQAHADFGPGFYLSVLAGALAVIAVGMKPSRETRDPASHFFKPISMAAVYLAFLMLAGSASAENVLTVGPGKEFSTIQQALDSAAAGDTLQVSPGLYEGPIHIKKSVRLIGRDFPVLDGGGRGTVVTVSAPDAALEGFVIRRSGNSLTLEDAGVRVEQPGVLIEGSRFEDILFGVVARRADGLVLRKNYLKGRMLDVPRRGDLIRVWYSDRVLVEQNHTEGGRDVVLWFSKNSKLIGNTFKHGRYGLHFMYCDGSSVVENIFSENSVGTYLMYSSHLELVKNRIVHNRGPSGYGVGIKDALQVSVRENILADNRVGLFLDHASGHYQDNWIAYNNWGTELLPSAQENYFMGNSYLDNEEQIRVEGMGLEIRNTWNGNYWSDYRGYDRDGDGFGDLPYRSERFFEELSRRYPLLRFFQGSPAKQALDFAARAFPVFASQSQFKDEKPRMDPLPASLKASSTRAKGGAWIALSGMLFLPLWGWVRSRRRFLSVKAQRHTPYSFPFAGGSAPLGKPAISVQGLSKSYGRFRAVEGLNFQVAPQETVVLWGTNGAGKTTVLQCLLGILSCEGELEVFGKKVKTQGKEVRKLIGYVPQEVRLHQDLTVWETLSFYGKLRRLSPPQIESAVSEWNLTALRSKKICELSGGMKQKAAIAIALLSRPPLLFLDEPTSNLDLASRHEFWIFIEQLKRAGETIVFSSHHFSEIRKAADRVIVLEKGRKTGEGRPEEIRDQLHQETLLWMAVEQGDEERASRMLLDKGWRVDRRGSALFVRVPYHRRAEPLHILETGSIRVMDFDFEPAKAVNGRCS